MGRKTVGILVGLALGLLAVRMPAEAQQVVKVPRIGLLITGSAEAWRRNIDAFHQGLRDLGYIERRSILIEYRWAEGKYDRLADLAAELVRLKVDVIVTHGGPGGFAAKKATTTIPIVVAQVSDAVAIGLVASLARPGGNLTGVSMLFPELMAKRLDLFKQALPGVTRVAVLLNPANPGHPVGIKTMEVTARSLGLDLQPVEVRDPKDLDRALSEMAKRKADALVIAEDAMFATHISRIVDLAGKSRLPTIGLPFKRFLDAGGLLGYGANVPDNWRRAAVFVDKILKGAKPADLPMEQPTKFELVINLKTARDLGLTIPHSILIRADQVIQ